MRRERVALILATLFIGSLVTVLFTTMITHRQVALDLKLNLRGRIEIFKESDVWDEVTIQKDIRRTETAIIVIDMWDKHWCRGATIRIEAMAPVMNSVLQAARETGIQIIHAPADTMDYYKDDPHRLWRAMENLPVLDVPEGIWDVPLRPAHPLFPIDDSDGGCDTGETGEFFPWEKEHPSIRIEGNDVISDNVEEIYTFLKLRGIKNLLIMGVHVNLCILKRPHGVWLSRFGFNVALVRDLTDVLYNPSMPPHVSHEEAEELVIEYIEKHWVPSVLSRDILPRPFVVLDLPGSMTINSVLAMTTAKEDDSALDGSTAELKTSAIADRNELHPVCEPQIVVS